MIILVFIIVILVILPAHYYISMYYANHADYTVRVSFTGLQNMFHDRYEYYAVKDDRKYDISDYIQKYLGDAENLTEFDKYKDADTNYWYMSGMEDSRQNKYDVSKWTNVSRDETEEEHKAHSSMLDKYGVPIDSGIMLINHGDFYLVETKDALYRCKSLGDIDLIKIMDLPNGGDFDCYIFVSDKSSK